MSLSTRESRKKGRVSVGVETSSVEVVRSLRILDAQ